jgi:hypothetical protein
MQRRAHEEFNGLAKEMSHRRDVAFFALNITTHKSQKNGLLDIGVTGTTSFFRARRYVTYSLCEPTENEPHEENDDNMWNHYRRRVIHNVKTDWGGVEQLPPHAVFVPTEMEITEQQKSIHGKGAVKDPKIPIEYVQSSLVSSTIVHATPTIIWFDRDRMAQLAFPWYRKIHGKFYIIIFFSKSNVLLLKHPLTMFARMFACIKSNSCAVCGHGPCTYTQNMAIVYKPHIRG